MKPTLYPDRTGWVRITAPTIPYVSVLIGLYLLSSAWISILLYHAAAASVLVSTHSWRRPRTTRGTTCARLRVPVVAGAALTGPVIYGAWSIIRLDDDLGAMLSDLGLAGAPWALFIVYYSTVNPLLEELFWREYLGSPRKGVIREDLWFAGYHILVMVKFVSAPWVAVGFTALVGAAWLWRQMTRECGGTLVPILSHAAADVSLIIAAFLLAA